MPFATQHVHDWPNSFGFTVANSIVLTPQGNDQTGDGSTDD